MKPEKSSLCRALAVSTILTGDLSADPAPQPQVSFTEGSSVTWNADWTGVAGRTYFAQGSIDLTNWEYLSVLEFGTGLKGAGIATGGAPKFFFRLVHVDEAQVTTEQEARDADFDNDGIPNSFEVEEAGSSPLDGNDMGPDSDSDGLPDGWERYHFGNLDQGPSGDMDGDGVSNLDELQNGTNPMLMDTDGDGIPDGSDLNPLSVDYTPVPISGSLRILTPGRP
jgi:hypothetical protein